MIVVMKSGADQRQVDHVAQLVREMGLKDHVIVGTERTVVAVIGNDRFKDRTVLESVDGVEKVVPILAPYKMASKEMKKDRSIVPLLVHRKPGAAVPTIGGNRIGIIAGPCSVESRQQTLEIAHAVKEAGAVALRGGAFKPRTNPYSFQGLAEEGLKILAEAREQTGLGIVTEVMAVEQVKLVAEYADVLQVGARNMQNFNLLNAVGEQGKPVLLKRGLSATLEEFLLAAEYIMAKGNPNVMLCERGIRTYEDYVRNTLALAAVPALQRASHLPVVVDPSQGTGKSYLVDSMCRASVAAGADGLIIEVHNDPEHALTDGAQSITPQQFADMMKAIRRIAAAVDREL
jgi:3-deoxy-7-phosphoheptulonate synthase